MRNIRLVVSYVGTKYNGFQTQPLKHTDTIQDRLEYAIAKLTGDKVKVISSGRTDAGVHARGQVLNFETASPIPIERWCLALNGWLPDDIVVMEAREVPIDFHSRHAAKRKTYRYTINNNRFPDVFHRALQYHHPTYLDVDAMEKALECIVGTHDFTTFCSRRTVVESHIRTIYEAKIIREAQEKKQDFSMRGGVFHIIITGNGFLYNMVRIIVGTLIQIGEGKKSCESMKLMLEGKSRKLAGPTAVAKGLTLWDVYYE